MSDVESLLKRFRALAGKDISAAGSGIGNVRPVKDVDVDAFLAVTLAKDGEAGNDRDDARAIRDAIKISGVVGDASKRKKGSKNLNDEEDKVDGEKDDGEQEDDGFDEGGIVQRALHEAAIESSHAEPSIKATTDHDNDSASLFPTLPTHIPVLLDPAETDNNDEIDPIFARLAALNASTLVPKPKTKDPGPGAAAKAFNYSVPGFDASKDDDLESWCCICNQDGDIQCSTCDGDVYCSECFQSSHGDGPGMENGHRYKKYQRHA